MSFKLIAQKGFNLIKMLLEQHDYIKSDCKKLREAKTKTKKPLKVTAKRYFVINGHKF